MLEKVFSNSAELLRILASLKVLLRGREPIPKCFRLWLCAAKPEHSSRIPPTSSMTVTNMQPRWSQDSKRLTYRSVPNWPTKRLKLLRGIKDNSCPRTGIPEFLVILCILSTLSGTLKGSIWSKTKSSLFYEVKIKIILVSRTPVNHKSQITNPKSNIVL